MAPKILVVDDNQELLVLLTQLFEEAGYEVQPASKGRQALEAAKSAAPALAVLDLLLPDMMGFALAEQLRKEVPALPLIFVTGVFKGSKHASEARQKFGSAAYFEKPFDAQKLLEAASSVVPPEKKAAAASIEDAFEVELDIDVEEDQPQDAMELTGRVKVTGGGNLTAELRGENLTASALPRGQATVVRRPPPGHPLATPLPSAAFMVAPKTVPNVVPSAETGRSRRGNLTNNFPSLITAFYLARETGELGVQRGKVKKIVYFEKGSPVFALSNLAADRFGQFLVRVGKIKPEHLTEALAVATATKRRTGDVLVEKGLLKDAERMYYVGQQVKSIIYSLFAWEEGTYLMSFKENASSESIKLDIHPANLILRGVKKLYKPERLKRLVHPEGRLFPSRQPAYVLSELELEKWESEFLPRVDGTRTVAELVAMVNRPEHVVMGFLCALCALSFLERRDV